MKPSQILRSLRGPERRLLRTSFLALIVVDLLDAVPAIIDKEHAHTWIEKVPGFWTIFGLAGCVAIILLSKWFGHSGIMTREDYYDE
jgi:hypothetical protein